MAIQGLSEGVQNRFATMNRQSQHLMQTYFNTTRRFYDVVLNNTQTLLQAEYAAAKDLAEATSARLREARSGGVEQFASVPAELLPLTRQHWFRTYEDVREHMVKSREDLIGVMRDGYRAMWSSLSGEQLAPEAELQVRAPAPAAREKKTDAASAAPAPAADSSEAKAGPAEAPAKAAPAAESSAAGKSAPRRAAAPKATATRSRRKTTTTRKSSAGPKNGSTS